MNEKFTTGSGGLKKSGRSRSLPTMNKKMLPVSVFSDETHAGAPELCHYFVGDHLKCLNYVDYLSEILINLVII